MRKKYFTKSGKENPQFPILLEILTSPQKIAKLKVAMSHITKEQRYAISLMVKEGFTQSHIA